MGKLHCWKNGERRGNGEVMAAKMNEFERIAYEAIIKAEKVNCSFDDFVTGLRTMLNEINDRLEAAEEELKVMKRV